MRPHQRRQQRQDDRNCQTEQRRLHAVSKTDYPNRMSKTRYAGRISGPGTFDVLHVSTNRAAEPRPDGGPVRARLLRGHCPPKPARRGAALCRQFYDRTES
jgi:hypothetical protein